MIVTSSERGNSQRTCLVSGRNGAYHKRASNRERLAQYRREQMQNANIIRLYKSVLPIVDERDKSMTDCRDPARDAGMELSNIESFLRD